MLIGGWSAADPAELVGTQPAAYVVASTWQLLDLSPAQWAKANVHLLLLRPEHELVL